MDKSCRIAAVRYVIKKCVGQKKINVSSREIRTTAPLGRKLNKIRNRHYKFNTRRDEIIKGGK